MPSTPRLDSFPETSAHNHAEKPLWSPHDPLVTGTFRLRDAVNKKHGLSLVSYLDLYNWSVAHIPEFWAAVWDETGVIGEKGSHVVDAAASPADNPTWFAEARLNWAENMLRCRSEHTALVSTSEPGLCKPSAGVG